MTSRNRLLRDTEHQKIAGVCSGLARSFDVDPVLVRVLFVVFTFVGGGALLAYVLLWLLVDPAPAGTWSEPWPAPEPSVVAADDAATATVEESGRAA